MAIFTLQVQNMSIFLKATHSGWYPEFLNPVVDAVLANKETKEVLDIGTGPGTLPQMLISKDSDLRITGIDIRKAMIDQARRSVSHKNVSFEYQEENMPLPFVNRQFDAVTFCSILFLLDDSHKTILIREALRVLKPDGSIIILTPSGIKPILSSFSEVWNYRFSISNFTFPVWKLATTKRARKWQRQNWPEKYAKEIQLNYTKSHVFNNNATIELLNKTIHN